MSLLSGAAAELGPKSGSLSLPSPKRRPPSPTPTSGRPPTSNAPADSPVDSSLEPSASVGLARWINIGAVLLVIGLITGAVTQQFGYGMAPSELGVLERSALVGVAFGALLNLLRGMRPQYYAISLSAAVVGSYSSGMQIVAQASGDTQVDPNEVVFGISFAYWAVGAFLLTVIWVAAMLLWTHSWVALDYGVVRHFGPSRTFAFASMTWLAFYLVLTFVQVIVQCGAWLCPTDPVSTGEQSFSFTIAVSGTSGVDASITIPGFITVMLGIGVVSFIVGAVLNHRLPSQRHRQPGVPA